MILHFIRRDFKTFRTQWALLLVMSAVAIPFLVSNPMVIQLLFMAFFMFGVTPAQQIIGAKFRSQHVMSRNYLLSLPIKREKNFLFILARLQIFMLPMIALAFWLAIHFSTQQEQSKNWHVLVLIALYAVYFSCQQIHGALSWEMISGYLNARQRFWAWVAALVPIMGETVVLSLLGLHSLTDQKTAALVPIWAALVGSVAICLVRIRLTQKLWMKT
jgi:hypothetical protein